MCMITSQRIKTYGTYPKFGQKYYHYVPSLKNQGKHADCITIMTYMYYDEVKQWEEKINTIVEPDDRGNAYMAQKRKEDIIIALMEERFPELQGK